MRTNPNTTKQRRLASVAVALVALFLLGLAGDAPIVGQTPAQAQKAGQLYTQALGLHREGKITQADSAIQQALTSLPKNPVLSGYKAELDAMVPGPADKHALQAPKEAEQSIQSLAAYFGQTATNDRDKARMIYRWITDRIAYDAENFLAGKRGDNRAEAVLKNRKAVCAGYAELYTALGKEAGLEVISVIGFAKGYGYTNGQKLEKPDHAWNAVKLDGKWYLLDSTWGAGSLRDKKFFKRYDEYYWLTSPEQLIYDHFPSDLQWQLLSTPITKADYERWPRVPPTLFTLGVSTKEVRSKLGTAGFGEFAEASRLAGPKITVQSAPLERSLKAGTKYRWRVEAPGFQDMAMELGGKLVPMTHKGNVFEGEAVAGKGELRISGRYYYGSAFYSVLRYRGE
jgi:hypothetical protein